MRVGRVLSCVALLGWVSWTATAAAASVDDPTQAYPPLGLAESSGMAASSLYDGVIWVVEDTGEPPLDRPVIRAFAESGAEVGSVTLEGWNNRDTEALSMGPGRVLWVADIGDNRAVRETVVLHTFAEPDTLGTTRLEPVSYRLRYPDRPVDAEALMVDPVDGRVYVATKSIVGDGSLYVAPEELIATVTHDLTLVTSAPSWITDGSFTPDGEQLILLRGLPSVSTTAIVYDVARPGGGRPAEFTQTAEIRLPRQSQPEMLTVTQDGSALLVGSEGADEPVWSVSLPGPTAATTPAPEPSGSAGPSAAPAAATDPGDCRMSDLSACLDEPAGWVGVGAIALVALIITAIVLRRRAASDAG